ncbi:hypothetical protein P691DRAFT_141260 [Macrolepiota fuliginosa MF-IS2]|uniref:RING-type domain-containing protein n=1 Tax=Macrolepiota fuliginosa MF-IS2 TaxID=1400762 RepID=A0A9P5XC43_9AGAR|nr:hypothetical protein P691DRAFT_141260 [Macrolepiota fuliginosa MF-IS2]
MLTISSGSACDVCAEEYGPQCMPHSIPCGHVLCASCCTTIVEKTSSRLSPGCPFCRESFTADSVRLIRMDFTTSGWSTPRRYPHFETGTDFTGELLAKRAEQLLRFDSDPRSRSETRRLEDKVARIAAKKCSVEEVSTLHKELEGWLRSGKEDQNSSLFLSAALLRAILMNHLAHSEASRIAKTNELAYKEKIETIELTNQRFEADLKRQRKLYEQKSQECQLLRTEVGQLRTLATSLGAALPPSTVTYSASTSASASASSYSSSSEPTSPTSPRATSPTAYTSPVSPLSSSRYNSLHSRSASMSSSARPMTPATPSPLARAQTPAPSSLSHSSTRSGTSVRSMTPAIGMGRSYTPAPVSSRSMTPGPNTHYSSASAYASRSQTPAPTSSHSHSHGYAAAPPIPPKPRRLSQPSPPKMMARTTSEEKADARERWIPPESRVLVETAEGGSYYKKVLGHTARAIGVGSRT